jgi:hypothetical protein
LRGHGAVDGHKSGLQRKPHDQFLEAFTLFAVIKEKTTMPRKKPKRPRAKPKQRRANTTPMQHYHALLHNIEAKAIRRLTAARWLLRHGAIPSIQVLAVVRKIANDDRIPDQANDRAQHLLAKYGKPTHPWAHLGTAPYWPDHEWGHMLHEQYGGTIVPESLGHPNKDTPPEIRLWPGDLLTDVREEPDAEEHADDA